MTRELEKVDDVQDLAKDDDFVDQNKNKITADRIKQLVRENFFSGVTVALVSIALSPALAMAQGATAMMGLSTAIYGPALGGILGGSNYNILGPAGALVNIVSTLKNENGVEIIPMVALFGGVMSFMVYAFNLQNYCTMIPTSVLEGFSLGVATSIGLGQFDHAFGLYDLPGHKHFYMNVFEGFEDVDQMQWKEFMPFLVFFVVLMSLLKWKPKIPWIIVIAIVGVIYGIVMKEAVGNKDYAPVILSDIYPTMRTTVQLADFSYWSPKKSISFWNILAGSAKVSFVAVLETLISGRIADNKTNTRFDQRKEIFGMSIANIVCGLMGGTPCTGVLIRTNVNVQTKATHKTSQFLNAVIVFLVVVFLSRVFTYMPMCVIAAILVTSSCRLIPLTIMGQLWNAERFDFWILIITWLICVFQDGAFGLIIGSFLSFLKLSSKTSEAQSKVDFLKTLVNGKEKNIMTVKLNGSLNYINAVHFETQILDYINEQNPDMVALNLDRTIFVDMDGLIVLEKIFKKGHVGLILNEQPDTVLTKSWIYQELKSQNLVFNNLKDAKEGLLNESSDFEKETAVSEKVTAMA